MRFRTKCVETLRKLFSFHLCLVHICFLSPLKRHQRLHKYNYADIPKPGRMHCSTPPGLRNSPFRYYLTPFPAKSEGHGRKTFCFHLCLVGRLPDSHIRSLAVCTFWQNQNRAECNATPCPVSGIPLFIIILHHFQQKVKGMGGKLFVSIYV